MSENKLKYITAVLKLLDQKHDLQDTLGLSAEDLSDFLELLLSELETIHHLTIHEPEIANSSRVFNLRERTILSPDAQSFILLALRAGVITPLELEQALALVFINSQGYAGIEEVSELLRSVVQDHKRAVLLTNSNLNYIH